MLYFSNGGAMDFVQLQVAIEIAERAADTYGLPQIVFRSHDTWLRQHECTFRGAQTGDCVE
jgi:hypothetical protein